MPSGSSPRLGLPVLVLQTNSSCPCDFHPRLVSLRCCIYKYGAGKARVIRWCSAVVHPHIVAFDRRFANDSEVRHWAAQNQVGAVGRSELPITATYLKAAAA